MKYDMNNIGNLLKQAREKKSITQEEIAESSGLTKNHISVIERGLSKPSVPLLLCYCEKLEMSPNEILEYPDNNIDNYLTNKIMSLKPDSVKYLKLFLRTLDY